MLAPSRRPDRSPLEGARVRLEPLDPGRHAESLWAAAHGPGADPALWDHLPYGPFADPAAYADWARQAARSEDPLFFTVVGRDVGPVGVMSYLRMAPEHASIEIGHIWFGAAIQRRPEATEAVYLMARHAFDDLGHRRLEWKCDAANARSRRAAERYGFTFEGIFRQHMVVKGRNRDTAWYVLLDGEWPAARSAFDAWLDPANFDAAGDQRQRLADLRPASG
jgi:RimJ/RimL family protein N-acetyltransferase